MSPVAHRRAPGTIELLGAIFNLGIGLVDGLCDEDAETGCGCSI